MSRRGKEPGITGHDVRGHDIRGNELHPRVTAELNRQMGLLHCVAIMVGVVIGAGIFVSSVGILLHVKSAALLVTLNALDTRWAARTQVVTTVGKLTAILLIVALGIYSLTSGSVENFAEAFENSDVSPGSLVLAFYAGSWSYGGWNYLTFLADEVVNPQRNVPLALVLSLTAVTLVYLATNLAYFAVLPPILMIHSSAVAVTFMQHVLPLLSFTMPIFIALSVFGNINGTCLTYSRLFFVGAQNNHLPTFISLIRLKGSFPIASLITMLLLSAAMLAYEDVFQLMEMMGFSFLLNLNMALLSLLYLRWSQPQLPRPVKVPVALPVALGAVVLCLQGITLYQKPADCGIALLIIALGLPLYWLGVVWPKPRTFNQAIAQVTVWAQKILLVVPADPVEQRK